MKTVISKHRIPTRTEGVFYKEVFNENGTAIDKKFIIRWKDENERDRLKTIGWELLSRYQRKILQGKKRGNPN